MLGDEPVETDDLLLVTQFNVPPTPFGMVERARLSARLRSAIAEPATLICAPAGSGKTSLLSSVLGDEAPVPVAWLSLEPEDDVPKRFWRAILSALRRAGPDLASLSVPARGPVDSFPPRLVNALAALPERVVLVLDDLQLIRSRACLSQLAFLLLHAPPTFGVVLSTRADPVLPLHVLRVRGGFTEFRASDLAFSTEEAAALLAEHGVKLAEPLVDALCMRTEGWAAALRLAALNLRDNGEPARYVETFAGSDAAVADYLVAEVLERQPPRIRRFLLKTSILDRVCGELADAVTGDAEGASTLAQLERTNGFVLPLDQRREWYRCHRLFATLLEVRARRDLGDELADLHRRAARWYAGRGMCAPALRHAIAGGELGLGLEMLNARWFELFVSGRSEDIYSLVDSLPADEVRADPELTAIAACSAFASADAETGSAQLEAALVARNQVEGDKRRRVDAAIAVAELCAARVAVDFERAVGAARELLGHAEPQRPAFVHACLGEIALWSHRVERAQDELRQAIALSREGGLEELLISALGQLALCDALNEDAGALQRHAQEAIARAARRDPSDSSCTGTAQLALALAALSELRLDQAADRVERAASARDHVRSRTFDLLVTQAEAELHGSRGHPDAGLRALDRFEAAATRTASAPYEQATLGCLRARLRAALGDLEAAQRELDAVDTSCLTVELVRAQLLLASGEPHAAVDALERPSEPAMLARTRVERAVLYAVALDRAKEPERAAAAFKEALDLAEPSGHRWAFLTVGSSAEPLLRDQIRRGTSHRAFVGELIESFIDPERPRKLMTPLLEPLTHREEVVLRYLPTRLSNREIAAELFLSTNTVKSHLRNIYRKLDVERRNDAVARARELSLLTPSER